MVNLISLLARTGFLLFALMDANRSWKANSDRSIKRNWLMIICFIILFFWGDVICYMNLAYRSQAPYLNTIVSQVFLWGSAFVFITLRLFNEAVNQAVNSAKLLPATSLGHFLWSNYPMLPTLVIALWLTTLKLSIIIIDDS